MSYSKYGDLPKSEQEKRLEMQKEQLKQQQIQAQMMQAKQLEAQKFQQQQMEAQKFQQQQMEAQQFQNQQMQMQQKPTTCYKVKSMDDKRAIISSHRVCVFDIYGTWCAPCKKIEPEFSRMAQNLNNRGQVFLAKEDVEDKLSLEVSSVPAFDFYYEGKRVKRVVGADMNAVKNTLNGLLKHAQQNRKPASCPVPKHAQNNRQKRPTQKSPNVPPRNLGTNKGVKYN